MSDLNRIDRLAIRSSVSGDPLKDRQKKKWMQQNNVQFNADDGTYSFNGAPGTSFKDAVSEVYKDNPDYEAVKTRAEQGIGDFEHAMSKVPAGMGSAIGGAIAGIGSAIGNKYGDDFSEEQKAMQQAGRELLDKIPMVGPIISAATGVVDAIGSVTGLNLSNVDKSAANRAGVKGAATFNNIMNILPGNSMLWGWMGSRTDDFDKSDLIANLGGAYGGSMADLDAASGLAEKRMFFGANKMNKYIDKASDTQDKLVAINDINTTRLKGVTSEVMSNYNSQRTNRYQGSTHYTIGKHGMKLMSIEEINKILNSRKVSDIQEFKNGGIIGIDSSIIPEGKLHAHKHNLKDTNPDLEDVTKKGIPIVTLDEGGELQQVAEIEKEEIIFRKEITTKLEELYKDGSDEAMIEAGKLIAEELMTNTDDKTEEFINE